MLISPKSFLPFYLIPFASVFLSSVPLITIFALHWHSLSSFSFFFISAKNILASSHVAECSYKNEHSRFQNSLHCKQLYHTYQSHCITFVYFEMNLFVSSIILLLLYISSALCYVEITGCQQLVANTDYVVIQSLTGYNGSSSVSFISMVSFLFSFSFLLL